MELVRVVKSETVSERPLVIHDTYSPGVFLLTDSVGRQRYGPCSREAAQAILSQQPTLVLMGPLDTIIWRIR